MQIQNVNHIAINTTDLASSIRFYEEIMHLECLGEVDLGDDYVAYMKVDDTTTLELFVTEDMETHAPGDGYIGLKHLAFLVDDVDAWADYLRANNITITYGPEYLAPISQKVLLCEGPDNVIIELAMDQ